MKLIPLLFVFFASSLISLSLLFPGLHFMHDDQQVARLFLFNEALKAGQFPVRWVDDLGFGFGYPLFNFYPPFVYILGEIFHLAGFGFISSVKLVFFASIFLSGLAMYILVKDIFSKLEGLVAAIFYMALPYRALDVFVRGALAESFSFVWLPLILWSFFQMKKTNQQIYLLLSGIFLALLMITHNLIFLPFMILLLFYLLFLIIHAKDKTRQALKFLTSVMLGLALSAFFWLPALAEKKYTLVDNLLLTDLANYKIHFVYLNQLWNWPWGFGGSAEGLTDGISFKIGKLHIILSFIAIFFSIIKIKFKKSSLFTFHFSLFTFILLVFSAFMTTGYSQIIWTVFPSLAYLQFPWRFLMFTGLFSSILAGAFIFNLHLKILKIIFFVALVAMLTFTNLKLFKPKDYRLDLTDSIATTKKVISWDVSQTSFEYVPKGFPLKRGPLNINVADLKESEIPSQRLEVLKGNGQIAPLGNYPHKIIFNTNSQNPMLIRINNFYFPGWQAKVDGKIAAIDKSNQFKLITLTIPDGFHHVVVEFKNTLPRTLGNLISLTSSVIIVFVLIKWRTRKSNSI